MAAAIRAWARARTGPQRAALQSAVAAAAGLLAGATAWGAALHLRRRDALIANGLAREQAAKHPHAAHLLPEIDWCAAELRKATRWRDLGLFDDMGRRL